MRYSALSSATKYKNAQALIIDGMGVSQLKSETHLGHEEHELTFTIYV